MLIDWFTVGAQILNFIVLVWLLKRFLYKPILAAIDAREKKIATALADADAKTVEAKKARDEFEQKNAAFDRQRGDLLAKATDEANSLRQNLLDEARKATEAEAAKRHATMLSDAESLNQAIARRAQNQVFAIARKVLSDLATTRLETSLGDMFVHKLSTMEDEARTRFAKALGAASEAPVVRSAFVLPAAQHKAIQAAVTTAFSCKTEVRFETAPDLIGGIELATMDEKISWNIADYLKTLEAGTKDILTSKDSASAKPDAQPTKTAAQSPGKKTAQSKTPKSSKAKAETKPA